MSQLSFASLMLGGFKWDLSLIPSPGKDFVLASYPESSWACLIGSSGEETLELHLFLKEEGKFEGNVAKMIHTKGIFLQPLLKFLEGKYRISAITERNSKTAATFGKWTTVNTKKWQDFISAYFVC